YWYDAQQEVLVSLFQYLIGNTDWSLVVGDPGETCCHNLYALQGDNSPLLPLPYDFDVSGLVNPPYAVPPRQLNLYRLSQRLYRGTCPAPADLQQALVLFVDKKPDIYALIDALDGLNNAAKRRALRFIDEFYDVITDPVRV